MVTKEQIKAWIENGLTGALVEVAGDDGAHFFAKVSFSGFNGKSRIQQHQMVYNVLGEKVGQEIHALSLSTHIA
ncbi:MAG: BolA family transcriptional regulator [Legionellales bacterium]|jgi:acid stress-induced BolA-like protein IbaG/YrbA|nr:BolA family transcriptional regulator [Legionellales bacterium]